MMDLDELYVLCRNQPTLKDWERFWAKVDARSWRECWLWNVGKDYGNFYWNGKQRRAHRLLAIWLYGELPDFLVVDHVVCSKPPCVNPLHLVPTTYFENACRIGANTIASLYVHKDCEHGKAFQCIPCHNKKALKRKQWKKRNLLEAAKGSVITVTKMQQYDTSQGIDRTLRLHV